MSSFKVYPDQRLGSMLSPTHPVFQYVENQFHTWLKDQRQETKEMYFSDDAIYDKKGAIQQAIEAAHEEATDTGKPVCMASFDYDAIFQG